MKKLCAILLLVTLILPCLPFRALAEGVIVIGQNDTQSSFGGETELKPGETVKVKGEYSIDFKYCKVYGNNQIFKGTYMGYLESKDNGAALTRFDFPVGTHTFGSIGVTLTNRSKQNVNWLKRVKCTVVFDDQYSFDALVLQVNPDQTASDKKTGYGSTVAVDIEPLVAVTLKCFFTVPYIVRDSAKPLAAYVTVDQDTYVIDLRKNMEIVND